MMINVLEYWNKAIETNFYERIENNDKTITYQELFLFIILRTRSTSANKETEINIDELSKNDDFNFIEKTWDKLAASKLHKKIFDKPWDKVF